MKAADSKACDEVKTGYDLPLIRGIKAVVGVPGSWSKAASAK